MPHPIRFIKGNINDNILQLAQQMIDDGAAILDIGGQSTRPGSQRITVEEELNRVLPAIKTIHQEFPETIISIDTYSSKVAIAAVLAGASIVNDISAGNMDGNMLSAVANLKVPYVCMHMHGTPDDMQSNPQYDDVAKEVLDFFIARIDQCKKAGIADIIIDPGFGVWKNY
ncbi:MAG: dihydropteroate synthase [Ferruginibacter sp.]